jgi:hypothetical protein
MSGTDLFARIGATAIPESAEKVTPTVQVSRKNAKCGRLWRYVAFPLAGGTRKAFGGKRCPIVAPSPPPATTFRQQTRVVEHKG